LRYQRIRFDIIRDRIYLLTDNRHLSHADRNNRFSMIVFDILAVQFPRWSLIVCVPVARIFNFHDRVGTIGAKTGLFECEHN